MATATVFCRADYAVLCATCDGEVHAANKLESRHPRVRVCGVGEQAPTAVARKADATALCRTCDRDIHSANPLARRHVRLPLVPGEFSEEEAEAATWLLPDPNNKLDDESGSPEYKSAEYLFNDTDPYLDLDLISGEQKLSRAIASDEQKRYSADGVVPVQKENEYGSGQYQDPVVDGFPAYDVDYPVSNKPFMYNFTSQSISRSMERALILTRPVFILLLHRHNSVDGRRRFPAYHVDYPVSNKPFMYNFTSQSISQSVCSSSLDVGVVPDDHNATSDVSCNTTFLPKTEAAIPTRVFGVDREAKVLRYREKRKNRKFEKTIRYVSRKAYAETRPRIKGRFAKRSQHDIDSFLAPDASSYGVVPTFLN